MFGIQVDIATLAPMPKVVGYQEDAAQVQHQSQRMMIKEENVI